MTDSQVLTPSPVLVEGMTPDQILALPEDYVSALATVGPIVFQAGPVTVLGEIRLQSDRLVVELTKVDGGGEGVLATLWALAERCARLRKLSGVEWIARTAGNPPSILQERGFEFRTLPGVGEAYYCFLPTTDPMPA